MKIVLVKSDEWQGLYIDDKLVVENHTITASEVLEALGEHSFTSRTKTFNIDETYLEDLGKLPEDFRKIEKDKLK